ncbi:MAG: hypothetical protein GYA57_15545 [Myxococcales bacterium]|nr:hypothetical protein [Myxococcales bacterium]
MDRSIPSMALFLGVIVMFSAPAARSQNYYYWSTVVTACQPRITNGVDDVVTASSSLAEGGSRATLGTSQTLAQYFYCPVFVPHGWTFNGIEIRYKDSWSGTNDVWAGFYRQPWTSGSGNAVSLGSVTSVDSANVPNVHGQGFTTVTIDNVNQTCWVLVRVQRSTTSYDVRAYQVRLTYGILAADASIQQPIDCGEVEAKPAWAVTAEERERCLMFDTSSF